MSDLLTIARVVRCRRGASYRYTGAVWIHPPQLRENRAIASPALAELGWVGLALLRAVPLLPYSIPPLRRAAGRLGLALAGTRHRVTEPAPEGSTSGNVEADTQRINDIIGRCVKQFPEQYLWIQRRFRTQPSREDPPTH